MRFKRSRRELTSALTLLAIVFLALANSSNPPNGRTGAPGDGLCSDCHSQNNPPQDGNLQIDGLPSSIVPNSLYTLTVTVSNPNGLAERAGFQMVILNSNNQNAGELSNPSSSSVVTPSGGRVYHEHNPAKNFGAGTEVSWTVEWTSPSGPDMEMVTAYAAGIVANGAGGNSGDLLVTTNESGSLSGSALTIEVVSDPVSCFGGADGAVSVNVEGGTPGYSYLWSDGSMTQTVTGLTAGTYSVTVTDAQSSTAEGSADVLEPTQLNVDLGLVIPPSCTGDSDGSISASGSGGTPGYTYSWSNGASGATITGLPAGPYAVTVTDNNGCTVEGSTMLSEPEPLIVELVGTVDPSCEGASNGIIEVVAAGGSEPYTYIWSNGLTGMTIDQLPEGTYTVTVSDFNGCSVEDTYVLVAGANGIEISSETIGNVTCAGGSDGSIAVEAQGQGPLQFSWQDGSTENIRTGLSAGMYSVTITDDGGCSVERSYMVGDGIQLTLTFAGDTAVSCFGGMDANIMANVEGGLPPFSFMWSEGDGSGLGAGTYSVTATDANGCSVVGAFEISEPDQLVVSLSVTHETEVDANDGSVTADVSGGIEPFEYVWSNGEITPVSIEGLSPGSYCVTVTDANGCETAQCVTVNSFGCALQTEVTSNEVTCNGASDGAAVVTWTGASGDVSITWSTGDTVADITGLAAGSYSVTVTDTAGCVSQESLTIDEPDEIAFQVLFDSIVCEGQQVTIVVMPADFAAYDWTTGQTGSTVTVVPGNYCVTVTDMTGCTKDTCIEIAVSPLMSITFDSIESPNDVGPGFIDISVEGGTAPLGYQWFKDDATLVGTDQDVIIESPGDYYVVVTDAVGCSVTSDTIVFEVGGAVRNVAELIQLNLYPNPASREIDLVFSEGVAIDRLIVYSSGGGEVLRFDVGCHFNCRYDISDLEAGVYHAAVYTSEGPAVVRFVKL